MFCQKCAADTPSGALACPSCGFATASASSTATEGNKLKVACQDAQRSLTQLAQNPVGSLSTVFESLGQSRAMGVGIAFGVLFAFCIAFSLYRLVPNYGESHGFGRFMEFLLVAAVPFIGLAAASFCIQSACRSVGGAAAAAFIAGSALLPFGLVAVLAAILGLANMEVVGVAAFFCCCLSIVMLFVSLTRICAISDRAATISLPVMLLAAAWLSKIMYTAMQ